MLHLIIHHVVTLAGQLALPMPKSGAVLHHLVGPIGLKPVHPIPLPPPPVR